MPTANLDRQLLRRLSKTTERVAECEGAWQQLVAEERELLRRKANAKQALDEARAHQRQAVYDALQAGASTTALAREYRLSMATVNKYGKPVEK